ncbi:helix-turn-helix transcriptional regulator [Streptomyces albogriseolus]|uniref:helix-turn-helix transcriptional regulator n=1 Tax=Streptomyces albogriseolus TaxID=1887 RepID=UPI0036AF4479
MQAKSELARFLRARREWVRPEDVGLPATGRRRVPGLRREELALLAGISAEYYLRLEQGRDHNPSPAVLDALARVLLLDDEATAYLHALAGPGPRRRARRPRPESVPPGIHQLVMTHSVAPAFVHGRYTDVLLANPPARALSPCYTPGINLLRAAFMDPQVRDLHQDWDSIARGFVASVRALAGPECEDQRLTELVGELAVRSDEFRRLWARHDVRVRTNGVTCLDHPQVGPLHLRYEKLAVIGTDQVLVVYHALPGSESAQALTLLAALAAPERAPEATRTGAADS